MRELLCVCILFQSEERGGARDRGPSRRSKSEGPPGENIDGPGPIQSEYRVRYGPGLSPRARGRVMRSDSDPSEFDQDLVVGLPALPPETGSNHRNLDLFCIVKEAHR